MSDAQAKWLADHPDFKRWEPPGMVSLYWWADVSYLCPDGRVIPDGESRWMGPAHLISSGDTLYVVPRGAIKIGRECYTV